MTSISLSLAIYNLALHSYYPAEIVMIKMLCTLYSLPHLHVFSSSTLYFSLHRCPRWSGTRCSMQHHFHVILFFFPLLWCTCLIVIWLPYALICCRQWAQHKYELQPLLIPSLSVPALSKSVTNHWDLHGSLLQQLEMREGLVYLQVITVCQNNMEAMIY